MKKVLFATTALVATAGVAAADITLSGYGRIGLDYTEGRGAGLLNEVEVDQRLRLIITGTAESQNGIGFTAQTRMQWDEGNGVDGDAVTAAGGAIHDAAFHVKAGGLTLSVGNVSLQETMPGFYAGGLGYTGFMFVDPYYSQAYGRTDIGLTSAGTDGVVMVSYAMGAFTVKASHSDNGVNDRTNLGLVYSDNGYTVALTHQESSLAADDVTKLYVQGTLGGATVGLYLDDNVNGNSIGLTGTMAIGAATKVTLTAVSFDLAGGGSDENIGVGINHDLGGGVSFGAGVADMAGTTRAEAGVVFNF